MWYIYLSQSLLSDSSNYPFLKMLFGQVGDVERDGEFSCMRHDKIFWLMNVCVSALYICDNTVIDSPFRLFRLTGEDCQWTIPISFRAWIIRYQIFHQIFQNGPIDVSIVYAHRLCCFGRHDSHLCYHFAITSKTWKVQFTFPDITLSHQETKNYIWRQQ